MSFDHTKILDFWFKESGPERKNLVLYAFLCNMVILACKKGV